MSAGVNEEEILKKKEENVYKQMTIEEYELEGKDYTISELTKLIKYLSRERQQYFARILILLVISIITYYFFIPVFKPYCESAKKSNFFCKKCPKDAVCWGFKIKECLNNKILYDNMCVKTKKSYDIAKILTVIVEKIAWE
jgi:hypothetical protein